VRRGRNKSSEIVREMGKKGQHSLSVRRGRNKSNELVRRMGNKGKLLTHFETRRTRQEQWDGARDITHPLWLTS